MVSLTPEPDGLSERTWPKDRMSCWDDWIGPMERAAVLPEGRGLVRWAADTQAGFFGEDWFARCAKRFRIPVMSIWDWPLSSPIALVRLIERAARIALLTPDLRETLTEGRNGIRRSSDVREFDHLDLVLEIIGLAKRDGWTVECETPTPDGRLPDLRLTKGTISYTIEVTSQGTDREMQMVDSQGDALAWWLDHLRNRYQVEFTSQVSRLFSDEEFAELVQLVESAAQAVSQTGQPNGVALDFAAVSIYPLGGRPVDALLHEGPPLTGDLWPRVGRRLREKAERTRQAGPTWIRIDESGGLFSLTPAFHYSLPDKLTVLRQAVVGELRDYDHIVGVVFSHGAEPDWVPQRREETITEVASSASVHERRLPGRRRGRTFVVPVNLPRVILPDHLVMRPSRWYMEERGWLDWALNELGQPSITKLVTGEAARRLIP